MSFLQSLYRQLKSLNRDSSLDSLFIPINYFSEVSTHHISWYSWKNTLSTLEEASQCTDPVYHLLLLGHACSVQRVVLQNLKKPFKPLLGEILERQHVGGWFFRAEQISCYPPRTTFLLKNERLDIYIHGTFDVGAVWKGTSVAVEFTYSKPITLKVGKHHPTFILTPFGMQHTIGLSTFTSMERCLFYPHGKVSLQSLCDKRSFISTFTPCKKKGFRLEGKAVFEGQTVGIVEGTQDNYSLSSTTGYSVKGTWKTLEEHIKCDKEQFTEQHNPWSSDVIWLPVIESLRMCDYSRAQLAKQEIEERQRERRKEKWVPNHLLLQADCNCSSYL